MAEFIPSVGKSFVIIFLSEIADRTFILILMYSTKLSWFPILVSSLLSMGMMNILAISVGYLIPMLLVKDIIDWIGFTCFLLFGVFSIYESCTGESTTVAEEFEKVKNEEDQGYKQLSDNEEGKVQKPEEKGVLRKCVELFWFLAISELGDKSEITTIAIAALYDFYGVLCGTMLAYACTIMIAIFVGHIVSKFLSEKQMGLIGGIVCLLFALQILLYKLGIFTWH